MGVQSLGAFQVTIDGKTEKIVGIDMYAVTAYAGSAPQQVASPQNGASPTPSDSASEPGSPAPRLRLSAVRAASAAALRTSPAASSGSSLGSSSSTLGSPESPASILRSSELWKNQLMPSDSPSAASPVGASPISPGGKSVSFQLPATIAASAAARKAPSAFMDLAPQEYFLEGPFSSFHQIIDENGTPVPNKHSAPTTLGECIRALQQEMGYFHKTNVLEDKDATAVQN